MARIAKIEARSYTDGPGGPRTVVFFQGCENRCPGCQNQHLWNPDGGREVEIKDLAESMILLNDRFTLSGGDPFLQPEALSELVLRLRSSGEHSHIIVYSGFRWDELTDPSHPAYPWINQIFENIDVLVDGRFIQELDNPFICYMGSRNQRAIDVFETLLCGEIITLDWQNELILTEQGELILPAGYAPIFLGMGEVANSRMCGETQ